MLRVLQEGEVRPLGANEAGKVDIRVVAATHQDIPTRRIDGRFRQDLKARLAGSEVALPALRDRLEDLGTLIAAILPRVAPEPERIALDRFAARALFRYAWPSTSASSSERYASPSPSPTPARSRCRVPSTSAGASAVLLDRRAYPPIAIRGITPGPEGRGRRKRDGRVGYRSTFETLAAVMARSSQRSKVARSVHASMRASSSLLGVSCRPASTRRREARVAVS